MLKTQVKASSITNLTDARYFAAWEVKWLGFNLDTHDDNYIQPVVMKAIKEWVDGVEVVGEFGMQSAEEILAAANLLELDVVQVGPFVELSTVELLSDLTVIKEIIIETTTAEIEIATVIQDFAPFCQYMIIDFEKNGITYQDLKDGTSISLDFLSAICKKNEIILSIDCPSEELNELLENIQPAGLRVKGGEEEQVGMKSYDELDDFFEAIEILV